MTESRFYTVAELAERFRISPNTVYLWVAENRGPAGAKYGKKLLFAEADVTAWEASQRASCAA